MSESVCARDLFGLDGDAHNTGYVRISAGVFDILGVAHDAVLGFSGVGCLLSWSLVRSDSRLLVHFGPGVPKDNLRSDVATDGFAILKQWDARLGGTIEPVVGTGPSSSSVTIGLPASRIS